MRKVLPGCGFAERKTSRWQDRLQQHYRFSGREAWSPGWACHRSRGGPAPLNELKARILKGIEEINAAPVVHRWNNFDALAEK